jgi:hypothetical protein
MRLPNEDELSNLDALHKIASILEEDGAFEEAEFVNDLFLKLSAKKKKKKSGKNVPNNPSLWAECKAWAKRTFDVYPSAYSNGAAAKRYKSKGGTWRKADSELNTRLAQLNKIDNYDGQFDVSKRENPVTTEDLTDDQITSLANEIRTLDEEADIELRQHNYSRVSEIISEIETIQNQNPEVATLAKTVLDRLRTFLRVSQETSKGTQKVTYHTPIGFEDNPFESIKSYVFNENWDLLDGFMEYRKANDISFNNTNIDDKYVYTFYKMMKAIKAANPDASLSDYNLANQAIYEIFKGKPQPDINQDNIVSISNKLRNKFKNNPRLLNLALEIVRQKDRIAIRS